MTPELVAVLARIMAQQAQVLGLQADNAGHVSAGLPPPWRAMDFAVHATELERLADSARMLA
jgi:hypothetical protein